MWRAPVCSMNLDISLAGIAAEAIDRYRKSIELGRKNGLGETAL